MEVARDLGIVSLPTHEALYRVTFTEFTYSHPFVFCLYNGTMAGGVHN